MIYMHQHSSSLQDFVCVKVHLCGNTGTGSGFCELVLITSENDHIWTFVIKDGFHSINTQKAIYHKLILLIAVPAWLLWN